jgi:hypothetical protein
MGRKPIGDRPLSKAEAQRRWRARQRDDVVAEVIPVRASLQVVWDLAGEVERRVFAEANCVELMRYIPMVPRRVAPIGSLLKKGK